MDVGRGADHGPRLCTESLHPLHNCYALWKAIHDALGEPRPLCYLAFLASVQSFAHSNLGYFSRGEQLASGAPGSIPSAVALVSCSRFHI